MAVLRAKYATDEDPTGLTPNMKTTPNLPPDLPPLPNGFKFVNRVLPCYTNDELGMAIYIDHVDPAREYEKRFVVK